jgi:hypothetical protein
LRHVVVIVALVSGLAAATSAHGDIPSPPGEQERYLLSVIERADHVCDKVRSYTPATGSDADTYANLGLDPFIVACTNGKTYLVGVAQRRPGPPLLDPSGKPVPYPDPVVKEIAQ